MGWRRYVDDFTGRNTKPAKPQREGTAGTVPGGNARGTVYDEDGTLRVVPIGEVLDEAGRWR